MPGLRVAEMVMENMFCDLPMALLVEGACACRQRWGKGIECHFRQVCRAGFISAYTCQTCLLSVRPWSTSGARYADSTVDRA